VSIAAGVDNNQEERWWFETSELEWLLLTAATPWIIGSLPQNSGGVG